MKMENSKCQSCSYSHTFCIKLNQLPIHEEIKISKTFVQKLPRCFEETILGEPKGALKQFRGPQGSHILEYEKEWVLHRDKIDPRFDPVGHLINDAPHVLVIGGFVAFLGILLLIAVEGEKNE
jgi:hypothetical protein